MMRRPKWSMLIWLRVLSTLKKQSYSAFSDLSKYLWCWNLKNKSVTEKSPQHIWFDSVKTRQQVFFSMILNASFQCLFMNQFIISLLASGQRKIERLGSNYCNSRRYSKFMGFLAQQHFYLPTPVNLDTTVSTIMKEKVCNSHPSIWLNTLKYGIFCVVLFSIFHV